MYYVADFRRCTLDDFTRNGYTGELPLELEKILCPDIDALTDFYRIKNGYSNVTERSSFSLEIITCNKTIHEDCAEEDDIIEFVDHLIFTQYFVHESINFRNEANYGFRPTRIESTQYSQFSTNYNSYRDNNNYISHNKAITNDFRFQPYADP